VQQLFAVILTSYPQFRSAYYSYPQNDGEKTLNTINFVSDTVHFHTKYDYDTKNKTRGRDERNT
jgi:hypothetical protein